MSYISFFLDHSDEELSSSVDLFNMPSTRIISGYTPKRKYIHAFFSDGNEWHYHLFDYIDPGKVKIIKKNELPEKFHNKSVFISLENTESFDLNCHSTESVFEPYPPWRSNIKMRSKKTAASYQGEIPASFLDMRLSLISCSPMFQSGNNIENFFYLVNINRNPEKSKFKIDILSSKNDSYGSLEASTNSINFFSLDQYLQDQKDQLLVFRSTEYGGVPIYFSKNLENDSFSLEHTHPPVEHIYGGKRYVFQKKKKEQWFR